MKQQAQHALSDETALDLLAALAHGRRLAIFRALARQPDHMLSAEALASELQISPSCLTFHASRLESSGLLRSWQDDEGIHFGVRLEPMGELVAYLAEDCCGPGGGS